MAKITSLIYSILIISLFVSVISIFIASGTEFYNVSYDNATLNSMNHINNISRVAEQVEKQENSSKITDTGTFDVLGKIFDNGYQALRTTKKSIDITNELINTGVDQAGLGSFTFPLKSMLLTMIIIFILIGIYLSVITKSEL